MNKIEAWDNEMQVTWLRFLRMSWEGVEPTTFELQGWTLSTEPRRPVNSSPLTHMAYSLSLTVFELFSWFEKRSHPAVHPPVRPPVMTNTALESIASSSGKTKSQTQNDTCSAIQIVRVHTVDSPTAFAGYGTTFTLWGMNFLDPYCISQWLCQTGLYGGIFCTGILE